MADFQSHGVTAVLTKGPEKCARTSENFYVGGKRGRRRRAMFKLLE